MNDKAENKLSSLFKENDDNDDKITLSYLLNLFDGLIETPGRIIIITSNYPDKLDKAFIRPGRIDVTLELKRASVDVIYSMLKNMRIEYLWMLV